MTPREIVRRTLDYDRPERVARSFGGSDMWAVGGVPGFAFNIARKMRRFDQPDLHGLDTLASHQERGRITFWCPVDIQRTLQTGDEAIIRAKAREMLDKLWQGRGGFIAGYYSDNVSIGLDPAVQQYACDEFRKRGVSGRYVE